MGKIIDKAEYERFKKWEADKNVGIRKGLPSEPGKGHEPDAGIEEQLEGQERDNYPAKAGRAKETRGKPRAEKLEVEEIPFTEPETKSEHECSGCGTPITENMTNCPGCGSELNWEDIEEE